MIPKLVRIRRNKEGIVQDCDVYIGRANNQGGWSLKESIWANPFKVKDYGSVHKVCMLYLHYVLNSNIFHQIPALAGKILGCWCDKPKKICNGFYCHGCVLIELSAISIKRILKSTLNIYVHLI